MKDPMKHRANGNAAPASRVWIVVLSVILAVSIGITVWTLFFRNAAPVLAPDYAPQEKEQNAEAFDSDSGKMEQQEGGGAVSLTYSKEVTVDLAEKTVRLIFANPQRSNQNMLIQVVIHDTVIVQSGILEPGYQVTKLDLWDTAALSPGSYDGMIRVYYYQPDSGEKAMLNTEIPLLIKVTE